MEGVSGEVSSDEIFDNNCTVCLKRNRKHEADLFCRECRKFLCVPCLEQHNEYMEDHTLVKPSAASVTSSHLVAQPSQQCDTHSGKILELFCADHDEVVCNVCIAVSHRLCKDVKYIASDIKTLLKEEHAEEVRAELLKDVKEFQGCRKICSVEMDRLSEEKTRHLSAVEDHTKKLINTIEFLEKATKDEVNYEFSKLEDIQNDTVKQLDETESDIRVCLEQFEEHSDNKPQLFITMKKGKQLSRMAKCVTERSKKQAENNKESELLINLEEEKYSASLLSLGTFQNHDLYKITQIEEVNVEVPNESKNCNIKCICPLSEGTFLLTDFANKSLKRLVLSSLKIDHCNLPSPPQVVCCVSENEVAVTLTESNAIQFVAVADKMRLTRRIEVDHLCCGIAFSNDELIVTCGTEGTVYVYSMSGAFIRKINETQFGEVLFTCNGDVRVSGNRLYFTDKNKGVLCTDQKGKELYRYKGTRLSGEGGLCFIGDRQLFVCGFNSNNIVQIGRNGEHIGEIMTNADGLDHPQSVFFDRETKQLIVSCAGQDTVYLCYLE